MILVDTNILSTFAKVDSLDLLRKMFGKMHISPNVFEEVKRAEELGYPHAENILAWVRDDIISIACPNESEIELMDKVPSSFGRGERDCVAMAMKRDALIVTNERKVLNYCEENDLAHVRLNTILRELCKKEIMKEKEVRFLINKMEEEDNLIITDISSIFS
uniref:Nucleic acid binding protein n=1 Tax=uncultured organism TaxID=155900 RepID=M1Q266_9ZZZZ|nr:nucleic acid binding protein [uncultured organism]